MITTEISKIGAKYLRRWEGRGDSGKGRNISQDMEPESAGKAEEHLKVRAHKAKNGEQTYRFQHGEGGVSGAKLC